MIVTRPMLGGAGRRAALWLMTAFAGAVAMAAVAAEQRVDIKDFVFSPGAIVVQTGATVVWRNQDIVPHTATAQDWDTGEIRGGAEKTYRFERPGRYAYRCRYHPAMQGVIEVKPAQ